MGEDEPQITTRARGRFDPLAARDTDVHFIYARDRLGFGYAVDIAEDAARGDRDHHHPGGLLLTFQRPQVSPGRLAQNDFLERGFGAKAQGAGTQAADRSGRNLDDPRAA